MEQTTMCGTRSTVRNSHGIVALLAALALASLLSAAAPAAAQTPDLSLTQATLQLWPEYDDPGLLVILAGTFSDTVTFPQAIALPLPGGAREIQATMQDTTGQLLMQPWQITAGKLTYTLPQPRFHVEYYLSRPPAGSQRELSYTFEAPYSVQTLEVSIQRPARATAFSVTPQPEMSFTGNDGLTYYRFTRTQIAAGEKLPIVIRYTKTDQGLSAPPTQPAASSPSGQGAAGATSRANTWLPWLLIGVGLTALAGALVYWWLQLRRTPPEVRASSTAQAPGAVRGARMADASQQAFCTRCGRQFTAEDRFCARCGAARG
jgi:hypothetical protein